MRDLWINIRTSRREYLANHGDYHRYLPLRTRLWKRHIVWMLMFLEIAAKSIPRTIKRTYCKTADRILGGNRLESFGRDADQQIAALVRQDEERQRKYREQMARFAEQRLQQRDIIVALNEQLKGSNSRTIH